MLGEIVEPQMASVWALSDFTKEIGATRVVPGTHVRPMNYEYEPQEDEICYAEMPKGSAVFYTGSVIHSGGANVSNQVRLFPAWVHLSVVPLLTDRVSSSSRFAPGCTSPLPAAG